MALHTLLDIEIGAPDPVALDDFYQEIGFVGSPGSWGGEGMPEQIKVSEAPYRQLKTLRVACTDESDLAGIGVNLDALGVEYQITNGQLLLVDPINKWQLIVRAYLGAATCGSFSACDELSWRAQSGRSARRGDHREE